MISKNNTITLFILLTFILSSFNQVVGAQEPEPDWNKILGYGIPEDEYMDVYGEPVEVSDIDITGYGGAGEVHTLTKEQFKEVWSRIIKWKDNNVGLWPKYVDISKYHVGVDKINHDTYKKMHDRWEKYKNEHNGQEPNIIGIEDKTDSGSNNNSSNAGSIQKKLMNAVGIFNSFTGFYNLCKGRGYAFYYNDVYTLDQEIRRLKNKQGLNCADISQLGYALAKEMGYQVKYQRTVCKTKKGDVGHILLKVKGGTDLPNWTIIDLAASLRDSRSIGQHWGKTPWDINENWLNVDDGKT